MIRESEILNYGLLLTVLPNKSNLKASPTITCTGETASPVNSQWTGIHFRTPQTTRTENNEKVVGL